MHKAKANKIVTKISTFMYPAIQICLFSNHIDNFSIHLENQKCHNKVIITENINPLLQAFVVHTHFLEFSVNLVIGLVRSSQEMLTASAHGYKISLQNDLGVV